MKRVTAFAVLLVVLATPAWAGFDEGLAAYDRGDYATAFEEWLPIAEQGDPRAQYALGAIYDNGYGLPQDYAEAIKWYRMAAEQGVADAQSDLGTKYFIGQGVPQDFTDAERWWHMAAEQGFASAQINLGSMYGKGKGVPQDYVRAHIWFSLAAAQGNEIGRENRDIVAKRMTPAELSKAQRLTRKWLEEHGQ